jgi:ATP-grasp domain-containing protein
MPIAAPNLVVLSEAAEQAAPSASARDLLAATEAARLVGCRVYTFPASFEQCGTADNALWHLPEQEADTPGLWIGYIPPAERYAEVYAAALARRIRLPNSPAQHRLAMEFDQAYPLLEDLTPLSVVVSSTAAAAQAGAALGYPVFVKGAIRSRKAAGWQACVASEESELTALVTSLLANQYQARGRAIVRRLVNLRHVQTLANGFPVGREFRIFLLHGEVVDYGYYWDGEDALMALTAAEEQQVRSLARLAAARLGTPYLAVDVGQLADGTWTVIETGDAQFAGLSRIPPLRLWNRLQQLLTASALEE